MLNVLDTSQLCSRTTIAKTFSIALEWLPSTIVIGNVERSSARLMYKFSLVVLYCTSARPSVSINVKAYGGGSCSPFDNSVEASTY